MSEYTIDRVVRVWDDRRGTHVDVCEDGDALGLVEVRSVTPDGNIEARIAFERKQAELVAYAILEYLKIAPTT